MARHKKHKTQDEVLDAFDIASQSKKKPGRPKIEHPDPSLIEKPEVIAEEPEEMSEQEATNMVEQAQDKKAEVQAELESTVDAQDWSLTEPVIPPELAGKVWVAVYRCPVGHKTKATNRQESSGVWCFRCKAEGKQVKAEIMDQFRQAPEPADDDLEKRKRARKGAE